MKQSAVLFTDVSEQRTASIDIVEPLYTYCLLYPSEIFPKISWLYGNVLEITIGVRRFLLSQYSLIAASNSVQNCHFHDSVRIFRIALGVETTLIASFVTTAWSILRLRIVNTASR